MNSKLREEGFDAVIVVVIRHPLALLWQLYLHMFTYIVFSCLSCLHMDITHSLTHIVYLFYRQIFVGS